MSNFELTERMKYIQYLDANNLYGYAMSKPLPTHGFRWMADEELEKWKDTPCFLEVDLSYPNHLHDFHNDFPLACERKRINGVEKLFPNFYDKANYVVHYQTLKLYQRLGLEIKAIHRGITFNESDWLKIYIDTSTKLRMAAKNDFEKDFFKLMNNSVFGKTMENIRNRVDIRFVTDSKQAAKFINKPNFERRTIFCEDFVAIHMKKIKLKFDKPIYLGSSILDLSKNLMYEFHYDYIKPKYGEKVNILYKDTDSLIYEIETDDFYRDISPDVGKYFDTSNFPKVHPSGIDTGVNKKLIGKFKDEEGGNCISEFVALRSRSYAVRVEEEEKKKCKGIAKATIQHTISFQDYRDYIG